eukprot:539461_1
MQHQHYRCCHFKQTRIALFILILIILLLSTDIIYITEYPFLQLETNIDNELSELVNEFGNHHNNTSQQIKSFNISVEHEINTFLQTQKHNIILDLPLAQSQAIYQDYYNVFCNGCDFAPIWSIVTSICQNELDFSMFLVGANYGDGIKNVLTACSETNSTINPNIYAFEAIPQIYHQLARKYNNTNLFKNAKNVRTFNNAISNEHNKSVKVYSDGGGIGGVHKHVSDSKLRAQSPVYNQSSRGFVKTLTFDYVLHNLHDYKTVDYVLIDVEGFEVNVVWGMKLEDNYMKFPMIQIELGGTWMDPIRHSTDWTQGNLTKYLHSFGYDLFLLGGDKSWTEWVDKEYGFDVRGKSKLLRVYPEMFMKKSMLKGDSGYSLFGQEYVQGNLLVVHLEYIRQEFKDILFKLIRNLQIEMFNHMKYVNYTQPGTHGNCLF